MIKKLSHIILSVLLLTTTIGLAVSKHYCHDNLVGTAVFGKAESCCDDGGCCTNENHFFQVKEDFSAPVISTVPLLAEIEILQQTLFNHELLSPVESAENFIVSNDPPPATVPELLAWEQVYLL
jgi:hypothetical protein